MDLFYHPRETWGFWMDFVYHVEMLTLLIGGIPGGTKVVRRVQNIEYQPKADGC
ncbi:MAG: hypothetical protein ACLU6I_13590 [Clostridium fessum]